MSMIVGEQRRNLLGSAALVVTAQLGLVGNVRTQRPAGKPSTRRATSPLQLLPAVNAGVLDIAYHEAGSAEGRAVLLMAGFALDGAVAATDGTAAASRFRGPRSHRIIPRAGHSLPQEAPGSFADAVVEIVGAGR